MRPEPEFSRSCISIEGAERDIDYHEKRALEDDIDKFWQKKGVVCIPGDGRKLYPCGPAGVYH